MKKLILGLFWVVFWLLPNKVLAAAEFETTYDVTYKVMRTGVTTVNLRISLQNMLSNVYADRFSLSAGFTDVENIKVQDAVGQIQPEVLKTDNQTVIKFKFVDKVVGKGKINTFQVSYETRDIAVKNGSIWEINIPQLETDKGISDQKVTLVVPSEFGLPAFITPKPDTGTNYKAMINVDNVYTFSARTLGSKAISAVFGTTQFMKFNLIYHLENNSPVRQKAEIALPPDTNYQRMIYELISPPPNNILVDQDGNWIASYTLLPGEKLNVNTGGTVRLSFTPQASSVSVANLQRYLASSEHWQVSHPQIKTLATQLGTPQAIYDYVVDFLSYDYDKVQARNQRLGAVAALTSPLNAICTEFTDLFVTLSRAAGIPARELEGYAFTNNDKLRPLSLTQDVLHAWPEYYDEEKEIWVQVDPTWGKTTGGIDYFNKLDLNHFVFVIHGSDSVLPLPAGAYKTTETVSKDVKVIASDPVKMPSEQLEFKARLKRGLFSSQLFLTVQNTGLISSKPELKYRSDGIDIISGTEKLEIVPPYATRIVTIEVEEGLGFKPNNLIVKYDQREIKVPIATESWKESPALKVGAIGLVSTILGIIAYTARRLLVRG